MTGVSAARGWWTTGVLGALYVLSYADRLALAILIGPVKADLHLSDTQVGLVLGAAFALFYSVSSLPLGLAADRFSRRLLIGAGALLWGLCTLASAFVADFAGLFTLRVGLGFGEAALTPAALSMIADLFGPERRARPSTAYLVAGTFGATGAFLIGAGALQAAAALHAAHVPVVGGLAPWRLVLLGIGAATLAVALTFLATAREPPRAAQAQPPRIASALERLWRDRALYGGLFAGVGTGTLISFSLITWFPTHLARAFGVPPAQAGYAFGLTALAASVLGSITAPWLARRLERRWSDALVLVAMGALGVAGVALSFAGSTRSPEGALVLAFVGVAGLAGMGILPPLAVQRLAPPTMRGLFTAFFFVFVSLLGLGLGPVVIGLLSDTVLHGPRATGHAIALVALAATPASLLLLQSARSAYRLAAQVLPPVALPVGGPMRGDEDVRPAARR